MSRLETGVVVAENREMLESRLVTTGTVEMYFQYMTLQWRRVENSPHVDLCLAVIKGDPREKEYTGLASFGFKAEGLYDMLDSLVLPKRDKPDTDSEGNSSSPSARRSPRLGDVVIYREAGSVLPGIVVKVWGKDQRDLVALQVFRDDGEGAVFCRAVKYGHGPDMWDWPD